ncbi:(S)-norcoclaurine synthase protein [Dioscorea alata]|uniref:(S)-norcoclaurine synthase protein n=1 Tax=Dioscorea alata TaxID=55571 RepID=A0ACB7UFQ4_DIOAL|nr:(S)-norcoclaurine synthase protein [Dioscorea alata]
MAEAANDNLNLKNTGGSLPVPNVQSLAASKEFTEIPGRYVRPEIIDSPVLDSVAKHGDIPIIDLSRLDHLQHSNDEILKLSLACEDWGFFQVINHGVPDEVMEKVKVVIKEFFQLPLEEKKVYEQFPGTVEGYGQVFVVSEEQKLDWGDMYFLSTEPVSGRNLNLWATNPPTFKDALEQYTQEIRRVANILLESIEKSLKLDKFFSMFEGGVQSVRINYYPPCPQACKVLGLSPHSDAVGLTVLLQVNEVQGLQIKKNGAWLPIKPLPGAFIVNIGDIIEIMSNGKYKSIEHRAIVNTDRERLSIATFHGPRVDAQVGPLPAAVEKNEPHYKTVSLQDYVRMLFSFKLEGKNILDHMKLED